MTIVLEPRYTDNTFHRQSSAKWRVVVQSVAPMQLTADLRRLRYADLRRSAKRSLRRSTANSHIVVVRVRVNHYPRLGCVATFWKSPISFAAFIQHGGRQ